MKPFQPAYQELYPTMNVISNLGTSFYFIVFSSVARLFVLYLRLIQKRLKRGEYWAFDWLVNMLKRVFTRDLFIRLFLQIHFGLLFSSLLNLQAGALTTTWLDYICMILSCLILPFTVLFQIFAAYKVYRLWKRKILITPEEEKKWGIFYSPYLSQILPMNQKLFKLQFESLQMMRRVITVCVLMWLPSIPGL